MGITVLNDHNFGNSIWTCAKMCIKWNEEEEVEMVVWPYRYGDGSHDIKSGQILDAEEKSNESKMFPSLWVRKKILLM